MLTQEEFLIMLDELSGEIPKEFFRELNGGVLLQEQAKAHPEGKGSDLWIMGEYCRRAGLGRYINIYYGSFMKVYGGLSYDALKNRVRHTLIHEFRHHLESLAGQKDLEIIDAMELAAYRQSRLTKP